MIAIINYGSGNVSAISNIYKKLNIPYYLASKPEELEIAKKLILPGVGAFDPTMKLLNDSGLTETLNRLVLEQHVPILGICVGMQVMAGSSDEGNSEGLGWIEGHVTRFDPAAFETVPHLPHMGWNTVTSPRDAQLFSGVDEAKGFYFLHSYYFDCQKTENVLARTSYCIEFPSAVSSNNIFGVQFHPEKSHSNGVKILTNFAGL